MLLLLNAILCLLLGFNSSASADCEVIDFDQKSSGLLTAAERKAKLDELRIRELSRHDACENSSGGGGASSAGPGSASSSGSGQNDADASSSESRPSNLLAVGESSIAVSSLGTVIKADLDLAIEAEGSLGPGAKHEALTAADNLEEMKAQIKAAADAETDPAVRAKLMERYKELSKQ
jgi:hypothetical protein